MAKIVAIHSCEDESQLKASDLWESVVPAQFPGQYPLLKVYGAGNPANGQLRATRATSNLHDLLVDPEVLLMIGLAHGEEFVFPGYRETLYDSKVRLPSGQTDEIVGKIVHLLVCDTARSLQAPDQSIGQAFYKQGGCRAFIGYTGSPDFDASWLRSIIDCDAQIDLLLAQGKSVAEAVEGAKALYERRAQAAPANEAQSLRALAACLTCVPGSGVDFSKVYLVPGAVRIYEVKSRGGLDLP